VLISSFIHLEMNTPGTWDYRIDNGGSSEFTECGSLQKTELNAMRTVTAEFY
jgi:hypothetical protein